MPYYLRTVYLIMKIDLGRVFYFQGVDISTEVKAKYIWTEHIEKAECFELDVVFDRCKYYGGLAVQQIEL